MAESFSNFARSSVAALFTTTSVSLTVADGSLFPAAEFYVVIDGGNSLREIVWITSRSGNVLTTSLDNRGLKGTTIQRHEVGATVQHSLLAHHIEDAVKATQVFIPGRPQGTLVNTYNFDAGVEGWTATGGTLSASGGKLLSASTSDMLAVANGTDIADGEIYATIEHAAASNDMGIIFRYIDDSNFYLVSIRGAGNANPAINFYKRVSGTYTSLAQSDQFKFSNGQQLNVLVRFVGDEIQVYLNDTLVLAYTDSTYSAAGDVGLRAGSASAEFACDTYSVYSLPSTWTPSWSGGKADSNLQSKLYNAGVIYNTTLQVSDAEKAALWVTTASNQLSAPNHAAAATDNNTSTWWQSGIGRSSFPSLRVDMGKMSHVHEFTIYNAASGDHSTLTEIWKSDTGAWSGEETLVQSYNIAYSATITLALTTPTTSRYWMLKTKDASGNHWRIYELNAKVSNFLTISGLSAGQRVKFYNASGTLLANSRVGYNTREAICNTTGTKKIEVFHADGTTLFGTYYENFGDYETWSLSGKMGQTRSLTGSMSEIVVTKTDGDFLSSSTSYVSVDGLNDLVIDANVGDTLNINLSTGAGTAGATTSAAIDAVTVVNGTETNWISGGTSSDNGVQAWSVYNSERHGIGGYVPYTIKADDVVNGKVAFRLKVKLPAGGEQTFKANSGQPMVFSAKNLSRIKIDGIDNTSGPIQLWEPDAPPVVAHEYDNEFIGSIGDWSEWNPNSSTTLSVGDYGLRITAPSGSSGTYSWGGIVKDINSLDNFTIITKLSVGNKGLPSDHYDVGLILGQGLESAPTNEFYTHMLRWNDTNQHFEVLAGRFDYNSYNGHLPVSEGYSERVNTIYMKAVVSGVTVESFVSTDGKAWVALAPAYTSQLPKPTTIGVALSSQASSPVWVDVEYVRVLNTTAYDASSGRKIAVNSGNDSSTRYTVIPEWKGFDIDAPKAVADYVDDEFNSTTLNSKWTVVAGTSGTVGLLDTTNVSRYDLTTDKGALLTQAGNDGTRAIKLRQDYTVPDGRSIIVALDTPISLDAAMASTQLYYRLHLNNNDTDIRTGNYLDMYILVDGTGFNIQTYDGTNNYATNWTSGTSLGNKVYLRIARSGLVYTPMWSHTGETWSTLPSHTFGSALDNVWITHANLAAVSPSTPQIQKWHWIRQGSNALNPWQTRPDAGVKIQGAKVRDRLWVPDQDNPLGLDDEFDDDLIDPSWIRFDPSGTTEWKESAGVLSCKFENQSSAHLAGQFKSLGGLTFPLYVEVAFNSYKALSSDNHFVGLCLSDGVTNSSNALYWSHFSGSGGTQRDVRTGTLSNMSANPYIGAARDESELTVYYYRLVWEDVNTFSTWISPDAVMWLKMSSHSFTMTPTHFGLCVTKWGTAVPTDVASFKYVRVRKGLPS